MKQNAAPSAEKGRVTIGIDLGGTNLRIAAFDSGWNRLNSITVPTRVADGPAEVVRDMVDSIDRLRQQWGRIPSCSGWIRSSGTARAALRAILPASESTRVRRICA